MKGMEAERYLSSVTPGAGSSTLEDPDSLEAPDSFLQHRESVSDHSVLKQRFSNKGETQTK